MLTEPPGTIIILQLSGAEVFVGVAVLGIVLGVGVAVHELLHVLVLRAAGVRVTVKWLYGGRGGRLGSALLGNWASVHMVSVPKDVPPWQLRVASISPLMMAIPLFAVVGGIAPDPFAGENFHAKLAVIAWLACALPSPADFSLYWNAEHAIEDLARV